MRCCHTAFWYYNYTHDFLPSNEWTGCCGALLGAVSVTVYSVFGKWDFSISGWVPRGLYGRASFDIGMACSKTERISKYLTLILPPSYPSIND